MQTANSFFARISPVGEVSREQNAFWMAHSDYIRGVSKDFCITLRQALLCLMVARELGEYSEQESLVACVEMARDGLL